MIAKNEASASNEAVVYARASLLQSQQSHVKICTIVTQTTAADIANK